MFGNRTILFPIFVTLLGLTACGEDSVQPATQIEGKWGAHVHLEIYTRQVYSSKDSTKFSRCGCKNNSNCDAVVKNTGKIPRGCGLFEDDAYLVEPLEFIKSTNK